MTKAFVGASEAFSRVGRTVANVVKNIAKSIKTAAQFVATPWILFRKKAPLASFIVGRIFTMVLILFVLGFVIFALMDLAPGDIVDQLMMQQLFAGDNSAGGIGASGASSAASGENVTSGDQFELMRQELGLDKPFYVQYFRWLKQVLVYHDLGVSLISKAPVGFLIGSRLANSVLLNLISLVIITIISFALGVWFSSKEGTGIDLAGTFFALFFHSFPGILLLILLQLFASSTGLFPVTAYPDFPFSSNPAKFTFSYMHHIFLPLLAAFLGGFGSTLRMIRATMLDQMGQPYITNLRSRGISEKRIYLNHAFRNTLNPYITGSANLLASLFSGSLVLEIIFSYPGIGRLMYEAVLQEDINLVLANLMFISFLVLLGMVISDILLAFVDPRIRYGKES
ncbi:MAG: ABC transporter permease [Treponemataceae bacterium]|nr:ABC transporter permease [Spirochaetales bacterium]MDY6031600.1 ABC transporter permease [Treponemataceae bacterium]